LKLKNETYINKKEYYIIIITTFVIVILTFTLILSNGHGYYYSQSQFQIISLPSSKLEKNDDVMTEGKRSLLTLVFEFFQNKNKVCDRYLLTHVIRNVYKDDEKRMNKIETQHMIEEVGVGKVDINLDEFLNVMSSRMSNVID
jgi:hypothetical protein